MTVLPGAAGTAAAVVRDYLRRNPGAGAFQAPPVIAAALAEAFPCKG